MDLRAAAIHVVVCAAVGGAIAAFTPAKWLAASLWVSAAMYINGSLAYAEDAVPGGFDNPDGSTPPTYAKGRGATKFALQSLLVTLGLAGLGFWVQFG
jgi:hypothetical protein